MSKKTFIFASFGLALFACTTGEPEFQTAAAGLGPVYQPPPASAPNALGRICRNEAWYVEVPLSAPALPSNFAQNLQSDLRSNTAHRHADWFCGGQTTCSVEPRVVAVFDGRSNTGVAVRDEAHRRALRVYFADPQNERALEGALQHQCEIVSILRARVAKLLGKALDDYPLTDGSRVVAGAIAGVDVRIGRECDARGAGLLDEHGAGSDLEAWHRLQIGAERRPPTASEPRNGPHVALLDAAPDPSLATALQLHTEDWTELDPVPGYTDGGYLRHGSDMAILLRQVVPREARVYAYGVLDGKGSVSTGLLARSLDRVIFDPAHAKSPLLVNLSLGMPPEYAQPALLQDHAGTCSTIEDGAGSALRLALHVARMIDRSGKHPIWVGAAAGNRHGNHTDARWFHTDRTEPRDACLDAFPLAGGAHFFPAELGRRRTCVVPRTVLGGLVLPVGGVDRQGRRFVHGVENAVPPVVAPAERVMLQLPGAKSRPASLQCGRVGTDLERRYPVRVTGTSVASALTTAVAARVQDQRVRTGKSPLPADQLDHLLYLSGQTLHMTTARGLPVRRIDLVRAEQMAVCNGIETSCLRDARSPGGIESDPAANLACRSVLQSCGLAPTVAAVGGPSNAEVVTSGFDRALCAPGSSGCLDPACISTCDLSSGPCAGGVGHEPRGLPGPEVSGRTGPQPLEGSGCDGCMAMLGSGPSFLDGSLKVFLRIDPAWAERQAQPMAGLRFPKLVLFDDGGQSISVTLGAHVGGEQLFAGKLYVIEGLPTPLGGFERAKWVHGKSILVGLRVDPQGEATAYFEAPVDLLVD